MEPDEFATLERLASQHQSSVADLIRQAVQERWLGGSIDRPQIAKAICSMELRSLGDAINDAEVTAARSQTISNLGTSKVPKSIP